LLYGGEGSKLFNDSSDRGVLTDDRDFQNTGDKKADKLQNVKCPEIDPGVADNCRVIAALGKYAEVDIDKRNHQQ
jgi:hypothetical protein